MRNDELSDLIAQLTQLQVQQTNLLVCLQTATDNEVTLVGDSSQEEEEPRPFAIGDNVSIANPNRFQAKTGKITKIGPKRITVTSQTGQKILRAPKNCTLLK